MAISPWYKSQFQTQLAPSWQETLTTDSGTANLTGLSDSALTIYFKNTANGVETQGQGTLHIVQANPAIVSYQPIAADVVVGMYLTRLVVTYSNGADFFTLGIWSIEP